MTMSVDQHGTTNGYGNLHCRCDRCRAAWSEYYHSSGRRARSIAKQLAHGVQVMSYLNHHCGMGELKAQLGDPRPEGLTLSLVGWESPSAYWGFSRYDGKRRPYRLSTDPDDYAWETMAENLARKVYR